LIAVAAVAIVSESLLTPYHAFQDGAAVTDSDVHDAAVVLTVLTIAVFGLGFLAALFDNGLRTAGRGIASSLAAGGLAVVAVVALIGAVVVIGNPISYADDKWAEFTDVDASTTTGSTRLGSVG